MNRQAISVQIHLVEHYLPGVVNWDRLTQSFEIASMARYGNYRNLPLGSINHIDLSLIKETPVFFDFPNSKIFKIDVVEPLQLQEWGM